MPLFSADTFGLTPGSDAVAPDARLTPEAIVARLKPHLGSTRRARLEGIVGRRLGSVTVVLEEPHDPHNAAAVLRTCEATGVLDIHIIRASSGISWSRRVTQGADKWLNIWLHRSTEQCLQKLREARFKVYAASARREGSFKLGDLLTPVKPVALLFGNEHAGLTPLAIRLSDGCFVLPMHGFSQSFNLSVSVAIAITEVAATRRAQIGRSGDLPFADITRLTAAYYARSTRHALKVLTNGLPCGGHGATLAGSRQEELRPKDGKQLAHGGQSSWPAQVVTVEDPV